LDTQTEPIRAEVLRVCRSLRVSSRAGFAVEFINDPFAVKLYVWLLTFVIRHPP
jgi:hypothetical protein